MTKKRYHFEVAEADLDAFVAVLILGTLEAMRSGLWPLDAGIWTLGRPCFWQPLELAGVNERLTAVLEEADELSALAKLAGRAAADARLDEMITTVRFHLPPTANRHGHWAVLRETHE